MAHLLFFEACDSDFITIAYALDSGHQVTLLTSSYFGQRYVNDFIRKTKSRIHRIIRVALPYSVEDITAKVAEVLQSYPIDGVLCQEDIIVIEASRVCERLRLPFTSAVGVANARDKHRARQLLDANHLTTVRYAHATDVETAVSAATRIGYPVIVKPVRGTDSSFVCKCDTAAEVRERAQLILDTSRTLPEEVGEGFSPGILIEERLVGDVLSVEIGVSRGQIIPFMVSGRCSRSDNECQPMGAVMPADLSASQESTCFEYARSVCEALGLDLGIFHIEIMLTRNGPVLIEANPRIMGGVMIPLYELATGHSICDALLRIHLGETISSAPPRPYRTVTVRRIVASEAGRLPENLDPTQLHALDDTIVRFDNFRIRPCGVVRGNEFLGRFAVAAEDFHTATARAGKALRRIESALGLRLVTPV